MQLAFCYGRKLERAARSIAIPDDATQDPGVERRPSAYFFIGVTMNLAHEIDHLVYQRLGYEDITKELARHNEADADHFAVDIMDCLGALPLGGLYFFTLAAYWGSHRGDHSRDAPWEGCTRSGTRLLSA